MALNRDSEQAMRGLDLTPLSAWPVERPDLAPFYDLRLKKKLQFLRRSEMAEKQLQLRTKAMREKEELREMRKYKFSLIRIRFPDGLYLQVGSETSRQLSSCQDERLKQLSC